MFKFIVVVCAALFVLGLIAPHIGYAAIGQTAVVIPWINVPLTFAACLLIALVMIGWRMASK